MKYGQYLLEHKIWIILFGGLLCSLEIFLLTFSGSGWLMLYTAAAALFAFFLGTYFEYYRWKKYFEKLQGLIAGLDKKYLLCELVEAGATQEEKCLKELLYEMEVSMNERVAGYRRNSREYKEYIETWVHEIKIPIGAMKMILANYAQGDYGLSQEIHRVEGYVEQALYYAKSNDVEKDYLINPVSLEKVVQGVVQKHRKVLQEINARIDLYDLEKCVKSDSKWLEFMVGQVVENSIKYRKPDGLCLEFCAEVTENSVYLHIKDNGCGIRESELKKVFEKGFTGSNGRSGSNATGIGLYLCRKLCKRLEHDIRIASKEGAGTTVTFVFPNSSLTDMR